MTLALRLGVLSALNLGIAFLFQWYVLMCLGPGIEADAFFAGMTIPQLVLAVISGSLMHVLVPLLSGESEDRMRQDVWGFLLLAGSMFGFLGVILYLTATWWVPLTVPGFDKGGQELTTELAKIQLIGMVFSAVNGVQLAACHAKNQFLRAEFRSLAAGAVSLAFLVWALPRYGISVAAWLATLRMVLLTLMLAPDMGRPVMPNPKSEHLHEAWKRIKPLFWGNAYYKTDPLVDRYLLSMGASGTLSLYYLAQQIYSAVSQIINKAIALPMVPTLSMYRKAGDMQKLQRVYHRTLLQVGLISAAVILVLGLTGLQLLNFFFGHGNLSSGNVTQLWWIMLWLTGTLVGGVMAQISSSTFYTLGDTSTPTRVGIYSYTLYVPAKAAAFHFFGVPGLALATSLFFILNLGLQDHLLRKKFFYFQDGKANAE